MSEKLLINNFKSNNSEVMSNNPTEKQQKIVEMAKDICRVKHNCNDVCNPISACDALKYAERAVEAGYSKQEWISVDERLPEKSGDYLTYHNGVISALMYSKRHKLFNAEDTLDEKFSKANCIEVSHWMPLPEAPKMKGGAQK